MSYKSRPYLSDNHGASSTLLLFDLSLVDVLRNLIRRANELGSPWPSGPSWPFSPYLLNIHTLWALQSFHQTQRETQSTAPLVILAIGSGMPMFVSSWTSLFTLGFLDHKDCWCWILLHVCGVACLASRFYQQ